MTRNEALAILSEMLARREVVYFSAHELLTMGGSHGVGGKRNSLPPKAYLARLADVAVQADMLRRKCGFPLRVVSAYRSPSYNKAIGGAKYSQHKQARALDLMPLSSHRMPALKKAARELHRDRSITGGLGSNYRSFVHIDTGGHRSW